jgi:hypothetical protein
LAISPHPSLSTPAPVARLSGRQRVDRGL